MKICNCKEDLMEYLCFIPHNWRVQIVDAFCSVYREKFDICDEVEECETLTSLSQLGEKDNDISISYKNEKGSTQKSSFDISVVINNLLKEIDPSCVAGAEWTTISFKDRIQAIIDSHCECCDIPPTTTTTTTSTTTSTSSTTTTTTETPTTTTTTSSTTTTTTHEPAPTTTTTTTTSTSTTTSSTTTTTTSSPPETLKIDFWQMTAQSDLKTNLYVRSDDLYEVYYGPTNPTNPNAQGAYVLGTALQHRDTSRVRIKNRSIDSSDYRIDYSQDNGVTYNTIANWRTFAPDEEYEFTALATPRDFANGDNRIRIVVKQDTITTTTTTTTTSSTTTTTTAGLLYYLADEYSCDTCALVNESVLVSLPSNHSVQAAKFYKSDPNLGFVYNIVSVTPQSPGTAVNLTTLNSTTCSGACNL